MMLAIAACSDDAGSDPADGADAGTDADTSPDATPDADDTDADDTDIPEPDEPDTLPQYEYDGPLGPEDLFQHGVASGDPLTDAVVIWTRITTDSDEPVTVWYEVSRDKAFTRRVTVGEFVTDGDVDFTAKIDVDGLRPGQTYYYRFMALGRTSVMGRTRTAPSGPVSRVRFGVCSCSSLAHGYFHGYRELARNPDLDAVLHLGDYIYEYPSGRYGNVRPYEPTHAIVSLDDYRTRYAQYRRDPDLQDAHRQHPFVTIWDDHESADNSWRDGANNHNESTEGPWAARKAASQQAYHEWMPIRDDGDDERIWRTLRYGNLLDLIMLDTRLWGRDEEASVGDRDTMGDPERTIMGFDQEDWFFEQLRSSTARWRIVGQQVMFGHLLTEVGVDENGVGSATNTDQWDGYVGSRDRVYDVIAGETPVDNVVILTGDIHSSWANDLVRRPDDYNPETGEGSVAVEFVTPGITSPGFPAALAPGAQNFTRQSNPTIRWNELTSRGFIQLDVTEARVQADWYHYNADDIASADEADIVYAQSWRSESGANRLTQANTPVAPRENPPELAD